MAATSFMKFLVITIFVVCVITFDHRSGEWYSGLFLPGFCLSNSLCRINFVISSRDENTFAVLVIKLSLTKALYF